jgi:hypothetical protein
VLILEDEVDIDEVEIDDEDVDIDEVEIDELDSPSTNSNAPMSGEVDLVVPTMSSVTDNSESPIRFAPSPKAAVSAVLKVRLGGDADSL